MPETLVPIAFTASSSSFWRRPVMKTYAPSLTKSLAEAKPIPVVPPVTTATLPCNLPIILTPARNREGRIFVGVALRADNPPTCAQRGWNDEIHCPSLQRSFRTDRFIMGGV